MEIKKQAAKLQLILCKHFQIIAKAGIPAPGYVIPTSSDLSLLYPTKSIRHVWKCFIQCLWKDKEST